MPLAHSIVKCFSLALASVVVLCASARGDDRPSQLRGPEPNPRLALVRQHGLTDPNVQQYARQLKGSMRGEIIGVLGHPCEVQRQGAKQEQWSYRFGSGHLSIQIRDCRVVQVTWEPCDERQTGVREDDFVGLIGVGGP
jgi:hypothetical protein